jgi:hypothetical protein
MVKAWREKTCGKQQELSQGADSLPRMDRKMQKNKNYHLHLRIFMYLVYLNS